MICSIQNLVQPFNPVQVKCFTSKLKTKAENVKGGFQDHCSLIQDEKKKWVQEVKEHTGDSFCLNNPNGSDETI